MIKFLRERFEAHKTATEAEAFKRGFCWVMSEYYLEGKSLEDIKDNLTHIYESDLHCSNFDRGCTAAIKIVSGDQEEDLCKEIDSLRNQVTGLHACFKAYQNAVAKHLKEIV